MKEASGRRFYFLKEQQKLASEALQNVTSVAWESGRPSQQGWTHTARRVHRARWVPTHSSCPFVGHTHSHTRTHPEEYNFLQPLTGSQKRGEGPLLCAVHNPACGHSSVPLAPLSAGTVRREDALIRHSGYTWVPVHWDTSAGGYSLALDSTASRNCGVLTSSNPSLMTSMTWSSHTHQAGVWRAVKR